MVRQLHLYLDCSDYPILPLLGLFTGLLLRDPLGPLPQPPLPLVLLHPDDVVLVVAVGGLVPDGRAAVAHGPVDVLADLEVEGSAG